METPGFDYELAMKLLTLSVETYREDDKFNLEEKNLEKLYYFHDDKTEATCYITFDPNLNELYIGFRGTSNLHSLITDIVAFKERYPQKKGFIFFAPRVHRGALQAYMSIKRKLMAKIKAEVMSRKIKQLFTTGHSLGGALATLCAFDCKTEFPDVEVGMYNFGSIRTGNLFFAMKYNKLVPNTYRIVNNEDFGARFPKLMYKHVGKLVFISNGKMRINPSRFFQFLENLDNAIGLATGQAVFDHVIHKYQIVMDNMVEVKEGKEYHKKNIINNK